MRISDLVRPREKVEKYIKKILIHLKVVVNQNPKIKGFQRWILGHLRAVFDQD